MSKVAVIAKLTAQPGKREQAVETLKRMVENTQGEEGTLLYALHLDTANEDVVWFYELYRDQDALGAHSGSDFMKQVGMELRDVMAARPELTMLTPVAAKGLSL